MTAPILAGTRSRTKPDRETADHEDHEEKKMRIPIWTLSALSATAFALWAIAPVEGGVCDDADFDGVGLCGGTPDNCSLVPNGPFLATGSCDSQEDGDMDGYGNACDTDFDNDGATGPDDLSLMVTQVILVGSDPNFDPNCDGGTGPDDLSRTLADTIAIATPGPSELSCAGTVPCP